MANESHSPETLAKAGQKVEDAYGNIEKNIQKKLQTEIEGLLGTWQGDASRAFAQGFQAFDKELSDVQNSLNDLFHKLMQSSTDYAKTEAEQHSVADRLKKLIG